MNRQPRAHPGAPPAQPWALPEARAERFALATGYPYDAPWESYLFRDGAVRPIDEADFRGRMPVLAHGSNRAPAQLARKFGHFPPGHAAIPVTFVWLQDYDVVFSAHVTTYGAVASTLQAAPGCRVRVAVTWLDDAQLARMHETEGNYSFGRLKGVTATAEDGPANLSNRVAMYLSDHGCLGEARAPLGLAAVPAEARPHPARTQVEVHELLRRRLAPQMALEDFVLRAIDCPDTRHARTRTLRDSAVATSVPHFEPF